MRWCKTPSFEPDGAPGEMGVSAAQLSPVLEDGDPEELSDGPPDDAEGGSEENKAEDNVISVSSEANAAQVKKF